MSKPITTLMLLGASPLAGAHALPGDTPLARQLEHVLSAPHHVMGLIILLLALGVVIAVAKAWWYRRSR
jgi:hypothetical protein